MKSFFDCLNAAGDGERELFIVEGISAANAADVARHRETQAILAVQGKPMNVERASDKQILANAKMRAIVRAVGAWSGEAFDLDSVKYDRVLILTDGDVDGIHASALLLLAFDWLMPELVASGRLLRVSAPLFAVKANELEAPEYAYTGPHRERLRTAMSERGMTGIDIDYIKSIAGLNADELWRVCLDPTSRVSQAVTRKDAAIARETLASFGRQP